MSNWQPIHDETRGAIPGKIWVGNGKETALFKPDSDRNESESDNEAY